MNALLILGTLFLLFLIFAGTCYVLAVQGVDTWIALIPTGEIKLIMAGESVVKVIPNTPGWYYDKKNDLMKKLSDDGKTEDGTIHRLSWLTRTFGIYLIPLFPFHKVLVNEFVCDKLVQENGRPMIKEQEYPRVNSLYFMFPYPTESRHVELKGNVTVKIMVQNTYRVLKPVYLMFFLDGKWFRPAQTTTQGFIASYARDKTFDDFRESNRVNVIDNGPKDPSLGQFLTGRILLEGAIQIAESQFVSFDLDDVSSEVKKAMVEVELSRQKAQSEVVEAEGKAKAIVAVAKAEANKTDLLGAAKGKALKAQVDVIRDEPGAVATYLFANGESMRNVHTLVGAGGVIPTLPLPENGRQQESGAQWKNPRQKHSEAEDQGEKGDAS